MNDYKQIRQRYLNGESQRSIAKSMGISRNTVKKYCEGENVPWERKTPEREASVLTEDVLDFITSCLEEDEAEGLKKQRHTARRIFDRLVEEYLLHNIITKNCRAKWRILHLQNGENCRGYSDHQAMKNPLQT